MKTRNLVAGRFASLRQLSSVLALCVCVGSLILVPRHADATVYDVFDFTSGSIDQNGVNYASGYLVGNCGLACLAEGGGAGEFRSYFQFNIPTLDNVIQSVELRILRNGTIDLNQSSNVEILFTSPFNAPPPGEVRSQA